MSKLNGADIERSRFNARHNLQQAARWGAIIFLAAGGLVLGLEAENASLHGGSQFQVGAGLVYADPATGHESFISIPALDAPPRGDAAPLLLLSATAFIGGGVIKRLTSEE
jgi:hypothetical protein